MILPSPRPTPSRIAPANPAEPNRHGSGFEQHTIEGSSSLACYQGSAKVIDSFRPYHQAPSSKLDVTNTQHYGTQIPPPHIAVNDWGLPVREQAQNNATRILIEAEKAKREGVIIPGLEESMKALTGTQTQKRVKGGDGEFTTSCTFSVVDEPIPEFTEEMFEDFLCSLYEEVNWRRPLQEIQAAFFLAEAMITTAPAEETAATTTTNFAPAVVEEAKTEETLAEVNVEDETKEEKPEAKEITHDILSKNHGELLA